MNTTIYTNHNYNAEYTMPDWPTKVTRLYVQDGLDEDGNETYIIAYRVNLTKEEANNYINNHLLPYLKETIHNRGADDDHYDYIPSMLEEAIQFTQLIEQDPAPLINSLLEYGAQDDYDLGPNSEYLDLTCYLK